MHPKRSRRSLAQEKAASAPSALCISPAGAMLVQCRSSFAMGWKEAVEVHQLTCEPSDG